VFIEIGADDGIDKSNTKFFEETLKWTGMCVEPSPDRFKLLESNRKCICENVAISDTVGLVEFLDISGWGKGLSCIIDKYDQKKNSKGNNIKIIKDTNILKLKLKKFLNYYINII